jgi:nucleoside-diphosphate-sugar epimerase
MTINQHILITGASGFVGSALLNTLRSKQFRTRGIMRRLGETEAGPIMIKEIHSDSDWRDELDGIDTVVHLAARVHLMSENALDPLEAFREVNVKGTVNFAKQSALAGVKRFIYLSSIKVNGEHSFCGRPFSANDIASPSDPYGISKAEAEAELRLIAEESGMEVVIIRPVMIYGPGVKGNFLTMMKWLDKEIPLPLGGIKNLRSLLALENLIDFIVICLSHPAAANQTFLVSDDEDISTTTLLRKMAASMGKKIFLFSIHPSLLEMSFSLLGMGVIAQRLCGSLQVDITKTRLLLGWAPPCSLDKGLKTTVESFRK